MSDSITKCCTKCGIEYPANLEYFHASKKVKSGLQSQCKKCRVAAALMWNKEHPQEAKNSVRKWRINHPEIAREKTRRWHREHPDVIREVQRRWRITNADKKRAANRNRKARLKQAEGTHTVTDIEVQYQRQRGKCYYCGCEVGKEYHPDHVVPLIRGGRNSPDNLVIACVMCNLKKHDKLPHEWIEGGRLL